ncbi:MAG: putative adhesin [Frankiales bacterium]|nr:putative adhesin [Frankiales bacterium]
MTHTRTARSRVLAGLATFATVAAVSIPLMATAASAAVSSVTANPATYQFSSPGAASVTADVVRTSGDVTPIRFLVVSGPDADKLANGPTTSDGDCVGATTPVTCTYGNTTPGVDVVRIFADSNLNQILDPGEQFSDATVTFYGPATNVDLKPDSDTAAAGTCNVFTATVTDAGGRTVPAQTLKLEATLTGTLGSRTLSFCNPATTNPTSTNGGGDDTTAGPGAPTQAQGTAVTDSTGRASFGIRSDQPGTATVRAYVDANSNNTFDGTDPGDVSNKTFTAGGTGTTAADAVTSLTVAPTSQTAAVGDAVKYVVTAKNSNADTTPNVLIQYAITGANPSTGTLAATDNGGAATLTYTAANAGTDTVKFWVNQTTAVPNTAGADASEPQATATTTIPVAPTGYTIDLTCAGTSFNTTAEDCVEPLTHKSEVFTAKVTKGGIAQANIPVRFTVVNTTAPGNPTPTTFSGVTDSTGKLSFTLTDNSAANNSKDTVTAAIAGQSVPEAGGVNSDSGTVTFQTAAAKFLTLTPALQTTQTGTASTFVATLTDQFGTPVPGANVDFKITGRNSALNGPALLDKTTDANGQATLTYTDIGPVNTASSDTIDAWADIVTENDVQNGSEPTDSSLNNFITEPATAGTVDLDVTNVGACASTPDPANDTKSYDPAVTGTTHPVCALIKTAGGAPLAGKTVTFTLTGVGGFVKADGTVIGSTTTAVTDGSGVASVLVASTFSGDQNITATIDNKSDTGVITYNAAKPISARFIDLTPNTSNIAPGQNNELTAKVTDVFGNPVAGITVDFTETGGGAFSNGTSSQSGVTGPNGTVSVTLTSPAGTTGTDIVTASINASQTTQCSKAVNDPFTGAKAGNCSDSSTYTFKNTTPLSFIIGTSVIKAGQFTKVVITGTPGDHVQVLVKGAGAPVYTVIGNLTLGSGGGAFLSVSPSTSSNYEVRDASTTLGPKFLLVKAVQSISVAKSGTTGIFTGLVKPSVVNRAVYVYYYVDGGHVTLACKTVVHSGGHFACNKAGFKAGQLIHVFAQTGADIYNAAGRSGLKDLQF